jgi:hypothetical protein
LINPRRPFVGRGLIAASAALLLVADIAGQVSAVRPPQPSSITTLVSHDETTCEFVARFDWSGFNGQHLLAEISLVERENGVDRTFIGHDFRDVSGRGGTGTWSFSFSASPEPARPIYATAALWTMSQNTRMVEGSQSASQPVESDCDA